MTKNLEYLYTLNEHKFKVNRWDPKSEGMKVRAEWLERQMRKIYSNDEVEKVLTNRRSADSDVALIEDFMRSEQPMHQIPEDKNFIDACEQVQQEFLPNRTLNPVSYPDLRRYPLALNVSAERPFTDPTFKFKPMGRNLDAETGQPKLAKERTLAKWNRFTLVSDYLRWKQSIGLTEDEKPSFHNLYNEIFQYNRPLIHQIKEGMEPFWKDGKPVPYQELTLHMRSHVVAADEPDKIRAVFGAPKLLLQAELMFIWPLQASYLNGNCGRMLWGREMSRGGWMNLYQEMHQNGPPNTVLCSDWSQFDKRLLHQLIRHVHRIWRSYFDFSQYEPTSEYPNGRINEPERIERLWDWMCAAITDTPILLPNGQAWRWNWNGFGSGFQQTQLMDSFCNAIMIYTCLLALGINIKSETFWARFQGDDSIIAFFEMIFRLYGPNFLTMLAAAAEYYFNAKLSTKKSLILGKVNGATVLSYFNDHGLAYRTDEDLLRHLLFPERPQDWGRLAASALGLAQASLGCSERFYNLCRLIWTKLVVEKEVQPRWKALRWMIRAGWYETIKQLQTAEFPTFLQISEQRMFIEERTESECQRQWPTKQGPRGDFYFLNDVRNSL
uniref:RNA-dependent RNA polymerase n=1 Tax=Rhizoctonia solani partitivirus 7 TaxID=2600110 RepID=A0A5B8HAC7_9VIRU|nr:RNA-dependent RNA polymerase [Rhizoctonia solani partitivirus 7]